jgi:hypothetical protein
VLDQDYATLGALLCSALLIALIIPAPTRAPRHEVGLHLTLLGLGAALAILAGVYALAQLPVHSAGSGALAWLIVMPCLWLARGPRPAEGYGYEDEEEDDDGGELGPRWPGAPPFPGDNRPERARAGLAGARVAWARPMGRPSAQAHLPQHAIASRPASTVAEASAVAAPSAPASTGSAIPASDPTPASIALAASIPAPASDSALASIPTLASTPVSAKPAAANRQRRLKPRPRAARADHRSIVHVRAAAPHIGRRRRASLRRRVLNRCRTWLWVAPAECVTFLEPEHEPRRRAGDDRRRESRAAPLG